MFNSSAGVSFHIIRKHADGAFPDCRGFAPQNTFCSLQQISYSCIGLSVLKLHGSVAGSGDYIHLLLSG